MEYLLIEKIDGIGVITINRPDVLNAMNAGVVTELSTAVSNTIADDDIGVIIITGSGEKAFVAGADIKAMQKMDTEGALEFGKAGQNMTLVIENSPKPVIAAVNGFALGGGCEISLACQCCFWTTRSNAGIDSRLGWNSAPTENCGHWNC